MTKIINFIISLQCQFFNVLQNTLISPNNKTFDQLRILLQEKISDGNGETVFEVGAGAGKLMNLLYCLVSGF